MPTTVKVGEAVQFGSTHGAGLPSQIYSWSLGNGKVEETPIPSPQIYTEPGRYTVSVASGRQSDQKRLLVLCSDGTLCNDIIEPNPSVTIDALSCSLGDYPVSSPTGRLLSKSPQLLFSGSARIPSGHLFRIHALGFRGDVATWQRYLKDPFDTYGFSSLGFATACGAKQPCGEGPINAFQLSPVYGTSTWMNLSTLYRRGNEESYFEPRVVWLYAFVTDLASNIVSVSERSVSCPAFVQ